MDRVRRRRMRHRADTELDVTSFMNLMIVLVPVLLLSMVFTHTRIIELNFPSGNSAADPIPESVHLEVVVNADALVVADGRGGTIRTLPQIDGAHDFPGLTLVMQELKRRMPEKRDITILLRDDTSYQTLVSVMDTVRSYPTVQHLAVVHAELFPEVSLGDAAAAPVAGHGATAKGGRS